MYHELYVLEGLVREKKKTENREKTRKPNIFLMASSNISLPAPPVFTGKNYEIWAVKMKAQLRAYDLWDVVETGAEPPPLQENSTVAQMRFHSE